jgi:hypothetical protein
MLYAEGHLAWFDGDPKLIEKATEIGISDFIENNEPGIDGNFPIPLLDGHRVRMPAGSQGGLKKSDVATIAQPPSRGEAGDPGADNGHPGGGARFHF